MRKSRPSFLSKIFLSASMLAGAAGMEGCQGNIPPPPPQNVSITSDPDMQKRYNEASNALDKATIEAAEEVARIQKSLKVDEYFSLMKKKDFRIEILPAEDYQSARAICHIDDANELHPAPASSALLVAYLKLRSLDKTCTENGVVIEGRPKESLEDRIARNAVDVFLQRTLMPMFGNDKAEMISHVSKGLQDVANACDRFQISPSTAVQRQKMCDAFVETLNAHADATKAWVYGNSEPVCVFIDANGRTDVKIPRLSVSLLNGLLECDFWEPWQRTMINDLVALIAKLPPEINAQTAEAHCSIYGTATAFLLNPTFRGNQFKMAKLEENLKLQKQAEKPQEEQSSVRGR